MIQSNEKISTQSRGGENKIPLISRIGKNMKEGNIMKNSFNRLISIAMMIALLLTSCVIPMNAMASGVEEDYSVDAYRYVLRTTTLISRTTDGSKTTLGSWLNSSGSTKTHTRTYNLTNVSWGLNLGNNASRSDCKGLPSNFGSSSSSHKFSVSVKPHYIVRFYATTKNYKGSWEHKRQRQVRRAYTTEWVDIGEPELSYSYASGSWFTFSYETQRR